MRRELLKRGGYMLGIGACTGATLHLLNDSGEEKAQSTHLEPLPTLATRTGVIFEDGELTITKISYQRYHVEGFNDVARGVAFIDDMCQIIDVETVRNEADRALFSSVTVADGNCLLPFNLQPTPTPAG